MRHDHPAPRTRHLVLIAGISALVAAVAGEWAGAASAAGPPREMGLWYNHTGKGAVEIRPCAETGRDADRLCGFIVWLKDPNNSRGEPLTDGYNPDPVKRTRPICGLPVLGSLRPMSDGSWDLGWVYDPEQGKSFNASIRLRSADQLVLTGYKGIKLFSKSFVWRRAPDDLPRCDRPESLERQAGAVMGQPEPVPPLPARAPYARSSQAMAPLLVAPRPVPAIRPYTTTR